jgi:DNA repair protein RecO (recombination protein O)
MATEKTDAIVIRLAEFSESSRVVTLFTRDFGRISALAKGAKRLKSAFEAALDLLSNCHIVFIRKSSSGLDLLTEAQLRKRFRPARDDLTSLYCGYYVAELLSALTEEYDPHPDLFELTIQTLERFESSDDARLPLLHFELHLLREIGQLPEYTHCAVCNAPVRLGRPVRFWVSQGGLICADCGRPEYEHTNVQGGTVAILHRLVEDSQASVQRINITPEQRRELRRIVTAAVSHVLERRPRMLRHIPF